MQSMTMSGNGITSQAGDDRKKTEWYDTLDKRGVYRRYHNCTFEELEQRRIPAIVKEQYTVVKQYSENLRDNIHNGIGLILCGPVGVMKTSLAVAVLQEALRQDLGGLFVTMASMLDNIFSFKGEDRLEYEYKLRNAGILVLDDLGAEHHEGWVKTKIDAIVSERYNRMKPIIVTTNLLPDELKNTYAERVIDRLRSTAKMIAFRGASLRETA